MIPIRLTLRNFLPYRVPDDLRFEGMHLACLTGANGAGKSSILDAITWALWGEARAKRDDDLIHQGQDEMFISLDFLQEGVLYRVVRQRNRSKRSSSSALNFFVIKPDGQPLLINEPNMRATQDKITQLLRLDYETFVHSAFLQQGKADAFTTQPPAKRKQILFDILGLALWEQYEERVKTLLKTIEQQLAVDAARILEINEALARKPALIAEQADAQHAHRTADDALKQAQGELEALKGAPTALAAAKEKKTDRTRRQRELTRDLDTVRAEIANHLRQMAEHETVIGLQADIESGYHALQTARDTDQSLNVKLNDLISLDKRRADLDSQLSAAHARLESSAHALQQRIADHERVIAVQPAGELESLQAELDGLKVMEAQRDDFNERETRLRETKAELSSYQKAVTASGKDLAERLEKLQSTDAPDCPLCGQPLTEAHRMALMAQLEAERQAYRADWAAANDQVKALDLQLKHAKTELTALEAHIKNLPGLLRQHGKLQEQLTAADYAAERLAEDHEQLGMIWAELDAASYAPELREALAQLDGEQAALGYDKTNHDATRQMLDENRRYEALQTALAIALRALPIAQEALTGCQTRASNISTLLTETDAQLAIIDTEISALEVQAAEYALREQQVRTQHTLERTAYERLVKLQQALSALEAQVARKADLERRREEYRYQEGVYQELKKAFGKNGIPTMIIETVIPELEATSNDLLARMTDGRMSLRLNTQKEKVSGGGAAIETLDIEIADELGTRNYELYSGGEAFRINFAIRVALAQLLARRTGAHLRTLFIDEGFGTQDENGRNKLIEAITTIQDDFDLILVITHIDELRDSFPVHVIVEKTSSGSRISVR
ncbi:MAG: SMC family ATPase [Armatimonadetes bacterium]|nr:SMC family ATPase [Anaerolineae bacterium]